MRLDIRLPIGLMFGILGGLLVLFGLLEDRTGLQHSLGINVNLWWGIVMLVFGALMFIFGRRGNATAQLAEESPEGRKIEEMEHSKQLEK